MANTINSELFPRIMAGPIDVLREETPILQTVRTDFSPDPASKGDRIVFNASNSLAAASITPAVTPPANVDSTLGYVECFLNQWYKSSFNLNQQDATRIITQNWVPPQILEATRAVVSQINTNVLSNFTGIYGQAGTAGTSPFASNIGPVADANKILDDQLCPMFGRNLLLGNAEKAAALKLSDLKVALNVGDNEAVRKGVLGEVYGLNLFRSYNRPTLTAGTGTSYVVNGTNAAGVTTVNIKTGSGTFVVGDLVAFQGDTQSYVVTAASSGTSINISPALAAQQVDGNTVTITGVSTTYKNNIAYDVGCFGLAMRGQPAAVDGMEFFGQNGVFTDPKTKIPFQLSIYPGYKQIQVEVSALWGSCLLDARRGCRLLG